MSFKIITGTLSADVASAGTFTVNYPTGTNAGHYAESVNHQLVINQNVYAYPAGFSLTFGSSNITVTNNGTGTWSNGSSFSLQAELIGVSQYTDVDTGFTPINTIRPIMLETVLGTPAAASSTALVTSQGLNAGVAATLVTTSLDVPRNVVAAWTTAAKITVKGTDVYGAAMSESMGTAGTSFTGKKAFKTITSITSDTAITGFTAGTGNVLGLPFYLPAAGSVLSEIVSGVKAGTGGVSVGTFVAGVSSTVATSTTGDVRGTYAPNGGVSGTDSYIIIAACPDAGYKGVAQA
jgi:hypothetical protein